MPAASDVHVSLTGGDKLKQFIEKFKKQKGSVKAGIFADATYPDGTSIAYIASIHENGVVINITPKMRAFLYYKMIEKGLSKKEAGWIWNKNKTQITIPPRPFRQLTIANYQDKWRKVLAQQIKDDDYVIAKVLEVMGAVLAGDLKKTITQGGELTPNAGLTVFFKGFNAPLIGDSSLINSISYEVSTDES